MDASYGVAPSGTAVGGAPAAPPAAARTTSIQLSRRARRAVQGRPVTVDVQVAFGCMVRVEAQARTGIPEDEGEYRLFDAQGTPVRVRARFRTKSGPARVHLLPRRLIIDVGRDSALIAQAHYT